VPVTGSADRDAALAAASKYDAWVWTQVAAGQEPELGATYRQFRSPEAAEPLTLSTVISLTEPLAVLSGRTAPWPSWHTTAGRVGAMLVRDDDGDSFVVSSWPDSRAEIYHVAATVPATHRRWLRFNRWLTSSAPRVTPIYLDRRDFEGFVSVLSEHGEVDASRLTGRYQTDRSSYSRGWPNPKSARAALEEVADEVQLRTMTLSVLEPSQAEVLLRVHLRRAAGATFYSGDFQLFRSVVLDRLAAAASRRVKLFRDRARTQENPVARPVEVKVGRARFDESGAVVDFLERVSRYAASDTAVLHRNPYLQVALTDYLDGSNFDIFITSVDRITVFPGYQASVSALVRLTDFLSEEFEADGVADVPAPGPVELEDLFAPG
jgi:hypothetical protein